MTERPTIEFPCAGYPIKVIASSVEHLHAEVVEIVMRHDGTFDAATVEVVPSREGNYASLRLSLLATGEAQLRALHADLLAHPAVKLVL